MDILGRDVEMERIDVEGDAVKEVGERVIRPGLLLLLKSECLGRSLGRTKRISKSRSKSKETSLHSSGYSTGQ